jgi:thousand and one amino acid protein kinase
MRITSSFQAQDRETNETVAIKKMNFGGKDENEKWADIIKEVKFLKDVTHPNIVKYRACFLKEKTCWVRTQISLIYTLLLR